MAEIMIDELYEVKMTEHDCGVQRPMGKKLFTTELEAKTFCDDYFSGNADCYWRADYRKIK